MSTFNDTQRQHLLEPIQPFRVQELDGISHLAAWDVIAHLNRVFGFEGWDKEILSLEPVYEHVGQREIGHRRDCNRREGCGCRNAKVVAACSVGYRCTMRLTVRNPEGQVVRVVEDAAMGTAKNQRDLGDAHDLAMKSAVSYALKRCAKDLGDQFGLSLYNAGQQSAVVQVVFPYTEGQDTANLDVTVQGDGIAEGDSGFGDKRGEEESWGEGTPAEPVREPAPAKPKAEAPEATPPEEKPAPPTLDATVQQTWVDTIRSVSDADTLRQVWKDAQSEGVLDAQVSVEDAEGKGYLTTIREFVVARLNEIEQEAKSA